MAAPCGEILLIEGATTVVVTAPEPDVTLIVMPGQPLVVESTLVETTLVADHQIIILQSDGGSGPTGPPGTGGSVAVVAGQNLQANRAVYLDSAGEAFHADHDTLPDCVRVLGITTTSALTGENVVVVTEGIMTTGPIWTLGAYYLGASGMLTSTPVTTGFALQVASAVTTSKLIVRPQEPIYLA